MPGPLDGKHILILATNGFEQSELEVPRDKLKAAGAHVDIVSPEKGEITGWDMKDWGKPVKVDKELSAAKADDYDALVLPGVLHVGLDRFVGGHLAALGEAGLN